VSVPNAEQAAYWEERAPSWLAAEDHIERIGGRFGTLAIELLGLEPGRRVLDVGCGSGATTIELGRRVRPGGEAVGADISPALLDAAERRRRRDEVEGVRFRLADVQAEDLGEAVFDAAYSRFGVMFFDDPVAAFANIGRALRPGRPLVFVCWQPVVVNEWMLVPGAAVAEVTGAPPALPEPGAPGPFSLSDPDRVRAVLVAAGFEAIEISPVEEDVVVRGGEIAEVVRSSALVGVVREALQGADDDLRRRILDAVDAALRGRVEGGELRLSAGVHLVHARRA
jgi:SAM-dependent methyltransferase